MWSSRLFWKLFLGYAALNLTLAAGFLLTVTSWQRSQVDEQVRQRLHDTAAVLRSHVEERLERLVDVQTGDAAREQAVDELQGLVRRLALETGTRLTLVHADGTVLADSDHDPSMMDNHANRPELVDAIHKGSGTSTRRSPTLGVAMSYLALPVRQGGQPVATVRVAVQVDTIRQQMAAIRWFLWLFALGVGGLAVALTWATVGRILQPLAHLTRAAHAVAAGEAYDLHVGDRRDELGVLAAAFNRMQDDLADRVRQSREAADRMSTVLASMDEGILAVDAEQRILLANEACSRLLSFSNRDVAGRPLRSVVHSRPVHDAVGNTLRSGRPFRIEFESAAEPRRVIDLRATRLPGDPAPGVVITLHDVTGLRRLENLRHEFVANVSHELKTPLAAIKAYAETLRLGAVNDPQHNVGFVTRIEEQADRLHQLILDMLQIARVESGKEAFEITDVPLSTVIHACIEQHAKTADRQEVTLSMEPFAESLTVRADEDGLRTILDNLIDNAIKYTPAHGTVTVRWRRDKAWAVIEVSDTGIGIADQDRVRVFERFYRVDKARSRELGGTGLGLSIVKHLAQSFGGIVDLDSELGKGSTFRVRLRTPTEV